MNGMTVRVMDFQLPEDPAEILSPQTPPDALFGLGVSLTLPYLEPAAIRVMKEASRLVEDDGLREEIRDFCGQEAQHFKQHQKVNDLVHAAVDPETAARLRALEAEFDADLRGLLATNDLHTRVAWIEGFEAMATAMAVSVIGDELTQDWAPQLQALFEWHLVEELEHREVSYRTYAHLYGDYFFRMRQQWFIQRHLQDWFFRFFRVLAQAMRPEWNSRFFVPTMLRKSAWGIARGFLPGYDPARVRLPADVQARADAWTEQAVRLIGTANAA